ncbi:MAG TPA: hypothetical protein VIG62_11265 [Blastocatellia bacterium]
MKFATIILLSLLIPVNSYGQKSKGSVKPPSEEELMKMHRKATLIPPSGASFYIAPITEIPSQFSLLLADNEGRTISGTFNINQVSLFEALLIEAGKFAETDESVGGAKALITRFQDRNDSAFIVDVAKRGLESRFYVTVSIYGTQRLTIDAGAIKRGPKTKPNEEKQPEPLFFEIVSRVQKAKAGQQ